jgi:hypothetical protein
VELHREEKDEPLQSNTTKATSATPYYSRTITKSSSPKEEITLSVSLISSASSATNTLDGLEVEAKERYEASEAGTAASFSAEVEGADGMMTEEEADSEDTTVMLDRNEVGPSEENESEGHEDGEG